MDAVPLELCLRLRAGPPLVLDGATGTELERRGVPSALPLWSAHALLAAPEELVRIHAEYAQAGAEAITANTFRTQRRTLARAGLGARAAELTRIAVELARRGAREAAGGRSVLVLGSAPPLEDCFHPELVPDAASLDREHALHAENLASAGVDAILAETLNSVREALAAARAARAVGLPVLVSFVCWRGASLLSGEPLATALAAVAREEPAALLVNCLPPSNVAACLAPLRESGLPFGVYPNLGAPVGEPGASRAEQCTPEELALHARDWLRAGARLVGGCCGTRPAHIRDIASLVRKKSEV
jgi:S-methylmethionine-dependent homocysteine/selenocysteine methylase